MLQTSFGRRRFALLASVSLIAAIGPAFGQTFTVTTGQVDEVPKTLNGTQTGTVEAGGTLRSTTDEDAIKWNNTSTGVVITNSGTIENTSTGRAIDLSGGGGTVSPRTLTFLNNVGAIVRASENDAFRIDTNATSGTILIDNAGLIQSGGTGHVGLGNALDLGGIEDEGTSLRVVNQTTGVIESFTDDAIKSGRNANITNWGIIRSTGGPNTSGGSVKGTADGIEAEASGTVVTNEKGALISGSRHGITADTDITVINKTGATIIGRNGSGVGSDGSGVITNYGTITGAYAGVGNIFNSDGLASTNGDGDGVDTDFAVTLTNHGLIQGIGAGGFDSGNRANNSEGVAAGGGLIDNYGVIKGQGRGILVNNDTSLDRSGSVATTINNYAGASIIGETGFAIRLENKLTGVDAAKNNDTIVNYGTIVGNGTIPNAGDVVLMGDGFTVDGNSKGTLDGATYAGEGSARFIRGDGSAIQVGEGADVLRNYGVITGNTGRAVNMEGGADTVDINAGSRIAGLVNGGYDSDTLNYNKVGLTEAKRAALQGGATVNIGGTLYTSFETVTGTAQSFSSFATSGGTRGIASILDNGSTTIGASADLVALIDTVATSGNVNAAMAQLLPGSLQGLTSFAINNALSTTSQIGARLNEVRQNGQSVDMSGAGAAMAMFNEGLFNGRHGSGLEQIAGGPDVVTSYASTPSATPTSRLNLAFASFARASGTENVYKARPAEAGAEWLNGFFINSSLVIAREGARTDAPATKYTTASIIVGIDRRFGDNLIAGVFGGFARTDGDLDTFGSKTEMATGLAGAYGSYFAGPWYANAAFAYGHTSYDTKRIALGSANLSSPDGEQFAVQGTLGTDIVYGTWRVNPEVAVQYTRVKVDGYTETGPAALVIEGDEAESLRTSIGARFIYSWQTAWGVFLPEWRAAWQHEFLNDQRDLRASFVDVALPGTFITATGAPGRDFGLLGVGISGNLGINSTLSMNYDALIGANDFVSHQLTGRFRKLF